MLTRRRYLGGLLGAGVTVAVAALSACGGQTTTAVPVVGSVTSAARSMATPVAGSATSRAVTAASVATAGSQVVTTSAPPSASGSAAASRQPVKLVLLHAWNQERLPLMQHMTDDFSQRNPGLTVTYDITATSSGMTSPRITKLITEVAAGSPPDVSMIWRGELPALAIGKTLQSLDQFVARDKFDPSIYYDAEWQTSRYANKTYVLPNVSAGAWHAVYYNRNELQEVGYGPDQATSTWSDYADHLKRLSKLDGGTVTRLGASVETGADAFVLFLLNNKGPYLSEDGRKVLFDTDAAVEAMQYWGTFYDPIGGWPAVTAFNTKYKGAADDKTAFVTGAQAMQFQNPSVIFHIKSGNPHLDFGVAAPPYGPRDSVGKSFINGGWGYGMPAGVKHPDDSWLLIHWLCATTEAAGWFMIQQLRPSPMKAVNADQAYLEQLPTVWPRIEQLLAKDVAVPITPVDGQIATIIGQAMTNVINKKGSPNDFVHQAATLAQQQLDTFWAQHGG